MTAAPPSALATLHPAYFALAMATGIVSIAAHLLGLAPIARGLYWLNIGFYAALSVLTLGAVAVAGPGTVNPGLDEVIRHGMPKHNYQCFIDRALAAGYQTTWIDFFTLDNEVHVNVVMHPQTGSWASRSGMDADAFFFFRQSHQRHLRIVLGEPDEMDEPRLGQRRHQPDAARFEGVIHEPGMIDRNRRHPRPQTIPQLLIRPAPGSDKPVDDASADANSVRRFHSWMRGRAPAACAGVSGRARQHGDAAAGVGRVQDEPAIPVRGHAPVRGLARDAQG